MEEVKHERLSAIMNIHKSLKKKKRQGLDLSKDYVLGEWVYSKQQDKFGKVTHLDEEIIHITYGAEKQEYQRLARVDGASAAGVDGDDEKFKWTEEKDTFLKENLHRSNAWLAKQLTTTVASVKGRTHRLKESGFISAEKRRNFVWDDEHDKFLLENIEQSNKWIADKLNTSVGSVKGRIRRLRERGAIAKRERKILPESS